VLSVSTNAFGQVIALGVQPYMLHLREAALRDPSALAGILVEVNETNIKHSIIISI